MQQTTVPTFWATIYVGLKVRKTGLTYGAWHAASVCQNYVNEVRLCVTVTPAEFVYSGGCEPGVAVGLINYPRFPSDPAAIRAHALALAERLRIAMEQLRVSVVMPEETVMLGDPEGV